MTSIKNVSITGRSANYGEPCYALGWETDDARFHVWVTADLDPAKGRIAYKNPLLHVERHQPGHFETRKLRIDGRNNERMPSPTGVMFYQAAKHARENGMIEAYLEAARRAAEAREKDIIEASLEAAEARHTAAAEEARLAQIREAAPELLAALREIECWLCGGSVSPAAQKAALHRAQAAIAKATA